MPTQTGSYDFGSDSAAARTATDYITDVGTDGVTVHPDGSTTDYARIDGTGMDVVADGTSVAKFGAATRVGPASDVHVAIDSDSMDVVDGTDELASFGIVQDTNPRTGQVGAMQGLDLGDGLGVRAQYSTYDEGTEYESTYVDGIVRARATGTYDGATLRLMAQESGGSARIDLEGPEASGGAAQATIGTDDARVVVGYADSGYIDHGIDLYATDGTDTVGATFGVGALGGYVDFGNPVPWREALGVACGNVAALGNTAAGAYKDHAVSFGMEFVAAPVVVVGFRSDSTSGTFGRCAVAARNVTTTGFTLRFFNGDSSNRNPDFSWIAIGTRASQL